VHRKIIIFAVSPICCFFLFCGGNLQNIEKLPYNKSVEISKSIEEQNAKTLKRKSPLPVLLMKRNTERLPSLTTTAVKGAKSIW
jgi:hypothetical protein